VTDVADAADDATEDDAAVVGATVGAVVGGTLVGAVVAGAFAVAGATVGGIGVAVGAGAHAASKINTRATSPIKYFRVFICFSLKFLIGVEQLVLAKYLVMANGIAYWIG
jgi:hypothetical protein